MAAMLAEIFILRLETAGRATRARRQQRGAYCRCHRIVAKVEAGARTMKSHTQAILQSARIAELNSAVALGTPWMADIAAARVALVHPLS